MCAFSWCLTVSCQYCVWFIVVYLRSKLCVSLTQILKFHVLMSEITSSFSRRSIKILTWETRMSDRQINTTWSHGETWHLWEIMRKFPFQTSCKSRTRHGFRSTDFHSHWDKLTNQQLNIYSAETQTNTHSDQYNIAFICYCSKHAPLQLIDSPSFDALSSGKHRCRSTERPECYFLSRNRDNPAPVMTCIKAVHKTPALNKTRF